MMSAPSCASRTACARPCPRAAPVISATLPWTRPAIEPSFPRPRRSRLLTSTTPPDCPLSQRARGRSPGGSDGPLRTATEVLYQDADPHHPLAVRNRLVTLEIRDGGSTTALIRSTVEGLRCRTAQPVVPTAVSRTSTDG